MVPLSFVMLPKLLHDMGFATHALGKWVSAARGLSGQHKPERCCCAEFGQPGEGLHADLPRIRYLHRLLRRGPQRLLVPRQPPGPQRLQRHLRRPRHQPQLRIAHGSLQQLGPHHRPRRRLLGEWNLRRGRLHEGGGAAHLGRRPGQRILHVPRLCVSAPLIRIRLRDFASMLPTSIPNRQH